MVRRAVRVLTLAPAALLVGAAPALAETDNGEGYAGETTDKVVTFFSLGVIIFFLLVIVVGSAIQGALEKRKQQRKTAKLHERIGW